MHARFSSRLAFVTIFVFCAALLAFGLILQHVEGIEPCPLCILQRYGFVGCGILALIAALHDPQGPMRRFYAGLVFAAAAAGGSVSVRQIWLQHFPPEASVCGPDLQYMLHSFPLSDSLPMLFRGDGDCSRIDWTFLSLSIAEWALISFTLIAALSLWQLWRGTPERLHVG
jgi:disulfide bond formation protein DsbB